MLVNVSKQTEEHQPYARLSACQAVSSSQHRQSDSDMPAVMPMPAAPSNRGRGLPHLAWHRLDVVEEAGGDEGVARCNDVRRRHPRVGRQARQRGLGRGEAGAARAADVGPRQQKRLLPASRLQVLS